MNQSEAHKALQNCYPTAEDPANRCLLYLLLTTGCCSMSQFSDAAHMNKYSQEQSKKYLAQAETYFEEAKMVLARFSTPETPELWNVQAWALMATYAISVFRWHAAYLYIGKISRGMGMDMVS